MTPTRAAIAPTGIGPVPRALGAVDGSPPLAASQVLARLGGLRGVMTAGCRHWCSSPPTPPPGEARTASGPRSARPGRPPWS
jgi:hypothetical protein